jgi:hypothetical protein
MVEERLLKIIDAADPEDGEDVAIRRLLATALSESGIELARMMDGHIPSSMRCERRPPWRVRPLRSPSDARRPAFDPRQRLRCR